MQEKSSLNRNRHGLGVCISFISIKFEDAQGWNYAALAKSIFLLDKIEVPMDVGAG